MTLLELTSIHGIRETIISGFQWYSQKRVKIIYKKKTEEDAEGPSPQRPRVYWTDRYGRGLCVTTLVPSFRYSHRCFCITINPRA